MFQDPRMVEYFKMLAKNLLILPGNGWSLIYGVIVY
jgi:hypothetical protein